MKRHASAVWQGSLKDGKGSVSTESGVLTQAQYSFGTRFENGIGTNPEVWSQPPMPAVFPWRSWFSLATPD